MGFFSKLFEKKECAICGQDIGLLGNRKLEDGDMCSKCARKLSPLFTERRQSTVEEIKQQLAYREENFRQLQEFKLTRTLGKPFKVYVEELEGIPTRFYMSGSFDPMKQNPDIIHFRDVASCKTTITCDASEEKTKNSEGEEVSYSPRRFKYSYRFNMLMEIENNPYFDKLDFLAEHCTVEIREPSGTGVLYSKRSGDPTMDRKYVQSKAVCDEIEALVARGKQAAAPSGRPNFCPNCGTTAGTGNFCANCGQKLA